MAQQTVSIILKDKVTQEKAKVALQELSWIQDRADNPYVLWRMVSNGAVAMMYTSGKLVLQGEGVSKLRSKLSDKSIGEFSPHIGVDEVGKGDFFGPLVVCAAYVSGKDYVKLVKLGVADSKSLTDIRIEGLGEKLAKTLLHREIVIPPSEYNNLFSKVGNISVILAQKHSEAVKDLYSSVTQRGLECKFVVFDQFSKRKSRLEDAMNELPDLRVVQFHKGESDMAVATASVLARYYFLKYWADMELKYSFAFPKGASEVIDAGKEFVNKFSTEELRDVAKISFKTAKKVLTLF